MQGTDLLSVVVPVYENAATLAPLHQEIARALDSTGHSWELLFVVDCSPDDSVARVRQIAASDPRVRLLDRRQRRGQSWALLTGLHYARGELIATIDADLQDPPSALPTLLKAMTLDVDIVFAGRTGRYESRLRHFGSRAYKRILSILARGRIPPSAGLFLMMRRSVARELLASRVREPYLLALIAAREFRSVAVPVARRSRPSGSSAYGIADRYALGWRGVRQLLAEERSTSTLEQQIEAENLSPQEFAS